MSWSALAWAAKCRPGSASLKLVLIALADRHNDEVDGAYPSVKWLVDFTSLNRKTVMTSLDELQRGGYITDSGKRMGYTKQIKVYRLNIETVPIPGQSQFRDSPDFTSKESRFRDTEPSSEPSPPNTPKGVLPPPLEITGSDQAKSASDEPDQPEPEAVEPEHVLEAWNELADRVGLKRVRRLTLTRLATLRAGIGDTTIDEWKSVLAAIGRSSFLQGKNPKGWKCTFDFMIDPDTFTKILEGNYDD